MNQLTLGIIIGIPIGLLLYAIYVYIDKKKK